MAANQGLTIAPVESLLFDNQNPRLPEALWQGSQEDILKWLYEESVLEELARSFITNGYFSHEPLLVMPLEEASHTVLEGNRRLGALTILLQLPTALSAGLRFEFEIEPTTEQLHRLREIPVLLVPDREEVRKVLGFRHIGGLKAWSPEAKARYLEEEIDRAIAEGSEDPFRDVARRVGSTMPAVRGQYLALKSLRVARDDLGVDSNYVIRERFGVWNRLLNSPEVRTFIGMQSVSSYAEVDAALRELSVVGLARVIGDLTPAINGGKAVLNDSRDATIYGKILANARALESLMKFGDLEVARQVVERGALVDRLATMTRSVELLIQSIDSFELNNDVSTVCDGLYGSVRTLRAVIADRIDLENND